MNVYLATVGGVTVLFGLGVWTAFTAGMRHGRAIERARAARPSDSGPDLDTCHPGIGESVVARISEVGGTATIESQPGAGTRVTLRVPGVTGSAPSQPGNRQL
jgi:hypothetical protein